MRARAVDRTSASRRALLRAGVVAAALLLSSCGASGPLRVVEKDGVGRVEVEWISFDPPKGRPPVLLVAVTHVASEDFYRGVQAALDRSAVVFIEGVKPSRKRRDDGFADADEALVRLKAAYEGAASRLGLASQTRALIVRPRFRRPDLSANEVAASPRFEEAVRGAEKLREGIEAARRDLLKSTSEGRATHVLRREFARVLVASEFPEDEVLIVRRNEAALRALLDLENAEGRAALCYGAAHSAHFQRRLIEEGWRVSAVDSIALFDYRIDDAERATAVE
jgi:hypothetical protein